MYACSHKSALEENAIDENLPSVSVQLEAGREANEHRDYKTALKLFQHLADQGNPEAQVELGALYEYGQGVAKDKHFAVSFYQKALQKWQRLADSGDAEAPELGHKGRAYSKMVGIEE